MTSNSHPASCRIASIRQALEKGQGSVGAFPFGQRDTGKKGRMLAIHRLILGFKHCAARLINCDIANQKNQTDVTFNRRNFIPPNGTETFNSVALSVTTVTPAVVQVFKSLESSTE